MGYTHYWRLKHTADDKLISSAIADCNIAIEECIKRGIRIAGWDGKCEFQPAENEIALNGAGDEAYETFRFRKREPDPRYPQLTDREGYVFDCCKTGRRPYDLAVTACLAILKFYLQDNLKLSSDGDAIDWEPANELVEQLVNEGKIFRFVYNSNDQEARNGN